ncbi:type VI secretion system Vgr family protein [Chitinibacter sp. S2-10]|uniref:type VI secretion system Vgr family protein n=1 Tax=Chitinibacter sp. S2-10 TaxID=3373597 RepID=UPI003977C2C5
MIDQSMRLLGFDSALGSNALQVESFSGEECLSGLFHFTVKLAAENDELDFAKLLGEPASLKIKLPDQTERIWHGIVGRFAQIGNEGNKNQYQAELLPWFWLLQHTQDSRIFQQLSVPDIVEKVFKARGFQDFRFSLSQSYAVREYCVQYRESDFAFVSRLLEEVGISYYFEHSQDKHTLVLVDANSAFKPCPVKDSVPYRPAAGTNQGDDIVSWMQSLTVIPAKLTLNAFNFEQTTNSLLASSPTVATQAKQSALDIYDYPATHLNQADGEAGAKLQMQVLESNQLRIDAAGDCRTLAAGYCFSLTDHYRAEYNADYLITRIRHQAVNNLPWQDASGHYDNAFVCQPKSLTVRPERVTAVPRIHGVQSAMVVGPQGEEIYTDKYGRVKLQMLWDRNSTKDDKSSCWVRVSHGWAGLNWGSMHIPRVGQEVLIEFIDGNPDQPIITGRVYNAQKMPPYDLPANKTQSGIKTRSTPNGTAENFNELRFEDKKGEEDVYFQAEKDFHRMVKNDDDLKVGHDQTIEIKNQRSQTIKEGNDSLLIEKGNLSTEIKEGDSTYTVTKGKHSVVVESDALLQLKSGNRTVQIDQGNDQHLVKTGNRSVEVSLGNDELLIKAGNQVTKINAGKSEMEAMQSIELKVGSNSIKIDTSGITIKGMAVHVEGTSSADVKAPSVSIKGQASASLACDGDTSISGLNVAVQGDIAATVKGNATAELSASGQTAVKGAIVMIN